MQHQILIGDNLEIMRGMKSNSIDLIYTDPPYNTGRDFKAYNDKWGSNKAFLDFLMPRVKEMHRLLKPTGSLYLHCDWHMSHYIKVESDKIFGQRAFRNEIVWCYTGPMTDLSKQFARKHDSIFWYSKGDTWTFNADAVRVPYKNTIGSSSGLCNRRMSEEEIAERMKKGKIVEDFWIDIETVARLPSERNDYPTQKPVALVQRILAASSNEGDMILDPFVGSGTTVEAAFHMDRNATGIDINPETPAVARINRLLSNPKLL